MKTNDAGVSLIREFEGLRTTAYRDPVGIWTIGYGHTDAAGAPKVTSGLNITTSEAVEILQRDLSQYERAVDNLVTVPLNENQFAALVSFTFNLGAGNLKSSTLLRKLNAGDYAGAAAEFPKWNKAGGKVLAGLTRRREAERALFETPVSGNAAWDLQRELAALGLYKGNIDGIFGPQSQKALDAFNQAADRIAALTEEL